MLTQGEVRHDGSSVSLGNKLVAVQSVNIWLSQTMTWLYSQVANLPAFVENHVVCEKRFNRGRFEVPHLHVLSHDWPRWYRIGERYWPVQRECRRRYLRSHIRRSGAGLIHSHFGDRGWDDLSILGNSGLRHIVSFYGYDVSRLPAQEPVWRERYQELFSRVDAVLCEGPYLGQSIADLGCPPEKILVHHLGVALHMLPFQLRQWRPGEALRVLIAGTFTEKKGIPYALEALAAVSKDVDVEVTVIGDATPSPSQQVEKARILELCRGGALAGRTRLLGFLHHEEMLREAYAHHVFLSPSVVASDGDSEGGAPVSVIEMAATGMPVVSTTHCDIPGVIRHGEAGLLAPERDSQALARHLRWLVEHPDRWTEMVVAARKHVEAEFDAEKQGVRLGEIYMKIASR